MPHQINHPFPPKPGGTIGYNPSTFASGFTDPSTLGSTLQTLGSGAQAVSNIAGAAGAAGKAAGAAGKAAGAASAINPLGLAVMGLDMGIKGFTAGKAAKDAGASTGGAILEGVLGTVGLEGLYEDPAIKAARKAEETKQAGLAKASSQLNKNQMEMKKYDYSNMNEDGTMATKKSLAAMTGTVAHNMSAAQYNSAIKFSSIAKNLGDLDKDGEMSSYETARQNAIEENMNKENK